MNTLKKMNELDKFNVYGLYQICAFNRDHINGYSLMLRNELINLIENVFYDKKIINIPEIKNSLEKEKPMTYDDIMSKLVDCCKE
jgi:hypothetical protein